AVSARAVVAASAVTAARARRRRVGRPGAVRWDTGAPSGRAPGLGALRGTRTAAGGPGSRVVGRTRGVRSASGWAPSSGTTAWGGSAGDRAGGEARDEAALEDEEDDEDRQRHDHRRGEEHAPVRHAVGVLQQR